MNYYIFRPIPKLYFETFYDDVYLKSAVTTYVYLNAIMVKFVLGYSNVANRSRMLPIAGVWFER